MCKHSPLTFFHQSTLRPRKKKFVSCNGLKKIGYRRLVGKKKLHYLFGQKCVFHVCFMLIGSWEVGKNFRVGIFLNKNLLG